MQIPILLTCSSLDLLHHAEDFIIHFNFVISRQERAGKKINEKRLENEESGRQSYRSNTHFHLWWECLGSPICHRQVIACGMRKFLFSEEFLDASEQRKVNAFEFHRIRNYSHGSEIMFVAVALFLYLVAHSSCCSHFPTPHCVSSFSREEKQISSRAKSRAKFNLNFVPPPTAPLSLSFCSTWSSAAKPSWSNKRGISVKKTSNGIFLRPTTRVLEIMEACRWKFAYQSCASLFICASIFCFFVMFLLSLSSRANTRRIGRKKVGKQAESVWKYTIFPRALSSPSSAPRLAEKQRDRERRCKKNCLYKQKRQEMCSVERRVSSY